ncbi:DMT family transporter [Ornithinibacillus massiliensis]|uniref:DMT family transporter n=1 Tax=Ornithinibacillus massiliensis TaxID=1944633 RepID=A0ABS5MED9_9BACI|nr:DMT family transporter [Ornithinibacillus massiliensis]MBS3680701.1 DMT family transporter [Ornithinibacillus massiliensis]
MGAKATFIVVMLIFGSLGLFVKNIELSSSEIALFRGVIGSLFLIAASFFIKQKVHFRISKRNLILLLLSGAVMGFNWIFLFEAYQYTTISNATLSYYFAPIFVMVLAPILFKEKWTVVKAISMGIAFIGLFLVVQPGGLTGDDYNHLVGIGYGLVAAGLYASVIVINKFIRNLSDLETTILQLGMASLVMFPYVWMTEEMSYGGLNWRSILLIAVFGIVHTGIAYLLYFSAIKRLKAQTIAVMSYIDPISAVLMAAIFLSESMTLVQIIGGILILGSTFLSEIRFKRRKSSPNK